MINGRREDLSKVFDRTWKANHNDMVKRGREKERQFMKKMFGNRPTTPEQRVETLHSNMNNVFMGQRQNNLNNIVKKWK